MGDFIAKFEQNWLNLTPLAISIYNWLFSRFGKMSGYFEILMDKAHDFPLTDIFYQNLANFFKKWQIVKLKIIYLNIFKQ